MLSAPFKFYILSYYIVYLDSLFSLHTQLRQLQEERGELKYKSRTEFGDGDPFQSHKWISIAATFLCFKNIDYVN